MYYPSQQQLNLSAVGLNFFLNFGNALPHTQKMLIVKKLQQKYLQKKGKTLEKVKEKDKFIK